MIMKWFQMKKKEMECKLIFYSYVTALVKEKEDIISLITNVYHALKDVPPEELQNKFISELANLVHDTSEKERM